jgi:acetyl-CoA carboxylase biotin carboxylase subunit
MTRMTTRRDALQLFGEIEWFVALASMNKLLIANRGEIAVRIIRACREMGISPVAVYSECDRTALHVRLADEAYAIGPSAARESYLRIDRILDAARASGADAVHPGYGFLAENEEFAAAVRDAGLTFVGPSAHAIEIMGSKTAARTAARRAGVMVVPGIEDPLGADVDDGTIAGIARTIGYPLLVKAVAGGGGKGMRAVDDPVDLPHAIQAARSEAEASFGDADVYLERRLTRPRHIEVQLLGDSHGTVLPFVERECSIQRRHQKVVEETPSLAVSPALRSKMVSAAASVAKAVGYTNAGTIEFLLDEDGQFYFLEMNTRLQVEHPITEMVTGLDLVRWQIRLARGERLDLDPESLVRPEGHAIECRIYAEDPDSGFLPSPGRILELRTPGGPGVRDDSGASAGLDVPIFYDPMISKLIVWAGDRPQAIDRMRRALREYVVAGIKTTIPFFEWLLSEPAFVEGRFHTTYLDEVLAARNGRPFGEPSADVEELAAIAVALQAALGSPDGTSAETPGNRAYSVNPSSSGKPAIPSFDSLQALGRWKAAARSEGLRNL